MLVDINIYGVSLVLIGIIIGMVIGAWAVKHDEIKESIY